MNHTLTITETGRTLTLRLLLCGLVAGLLAACPSSAPKTRWQPKESRSAGLPDDAAALIELADRETAVRPQTADRVDRALAALEKAAATGEASGFEVQWRISRASFQLAELLAGASTWRPYVVRGVTTGAVAAAADGERVEGHYYHALNAVKLAEADKDVDSLKPMMEIARRAAAIDPAYDDAGPLRLMGKVYMVAPEWPTSVGDREESVTLLKKALGLAPTPLNRLFLGEAFYHTEEYDKAAPQLRRALKDGEEQGLDARWLDEARDYLQRMGE